MTVPTLGDIRAGISTRLATISGLHASDVMPQLIIPPMAVVMPVSGTFGLVLPTDSGTLTFEIILYVQMSDIETGQREMDGYLSNNGATSINALWAADRTWGGVLSDSILAGWRDYGEEKEKSNGAQVLRATFDLVECYMLDAED